MLNHEQVFLNFYALTHIAFFAIIDLGYFFFLLFPAKVIELFSLTFCANFYKNKNTCAHSVHDVLDLIKRKNKKKVHKNTSN